MKKPKTGESNLDCPGHNFGPIWPPSISNESRRSAHFGGVEKLSKSSLTAEQSADLVKTKSAHIFFSPPLNFFWALAYVRGKFLSFLRVSSKILNGHLNMYFLDKFQILGQNLTKKWYFGPQIIMYEKSKVTWNLIWDASSKFQVIRFGLVWFGMFW